MPRHISGPRGGFEHMPLRENKTPCASSLFFRLLRLVALTSVIPRLRDHQIALHYSYLPCLYVTPPNATVGMIHVTCVLFHSDANLNMKALHLIDFTREKESWGKEG